MNLKTYDNLIILGDSHAYDLKALQKTNKYKDIFRIIKVVSVSGKTAQGLAKANNIDIYIKKIINLVDKTDQVGIFIGETDCGYAIWSRTQKYNTTKHQEICFAVEQLINFAKKLEELGFKNIFFMLPIIPLVQDYKSKDIPEIIRVRRDIPYSFLQRTRLTIKFNSRLQSQAQKNNYKTIGINSKLINPKTNLAYEMYQSDRFFHHLRPKYAIQFWAEELVKLVKD